MKHIKQHKKARKHLPPQAKVKTKAHREPRKVIISFRLRRSEVKELMTDMARHVGPQILSLKQLCRKLAIDYSKNLLIYADPLDRQTPFGANVKSAPICDMEDVAFLKELHRFLDNDPNNWRKLRSFLLGLGWPEQPAREFRSTLKDAERLQLARQVLSKMIKSLS